MKTISKLIFILIICVIVLHETNGGGAPKTTKKVTTKTTTKKPTTTKTSKKPITTTRKTTKSIESSTQKSKKQDRLDNGLAEIITRRNKTKIPRNKTKDRSKYQSNMRQSTDIAITINEITTFSLAVVADNSSNDVVKVESAFCPFKSITCNTKAKYRSYDGTCNNLERPLSGAANTPYRRKLSPAYNDGFDSPRLKALSGNNLPNTRLISLAISPPSEVQRLENNITHLFAIFGQFLTHDIIGTSATTDPNGDEIECDCNTTDSRCISLNWPLNDPYLQQTCMGITRSSASFPDFNCSISYREQLNLLSHYIDGSGVYGIDEERSKELRSFNQGLLKTSNGIPATNEGITGRSYLPLSNDTCSTQTINPYKCFLAGEYRTSENLGLVSMHTLFNREHNRIASELSKLNPNWSDEILYQETRKIVIALFQHIIYNDWLPMISGNNTLKPLNTTSYFTGYNTLTDPTLHNEFATAAFRMGHTLIRQKASRFDAFNNWYKNKSYDFQEIVFQSDYAYDEKYQGLNSVFNGLVNDLCWKFGTFGFQLQNRLFSKIENNQLKAVDLLATNIQRGRDHGLQSYVKYVKKCHNIDIKSFDDLTTYNLMNGAKRQALESLYENVADIDLYAGGISERKFSDFTVVGPTFACIIMDQFADIKISDRFYYENGPLSKFPHAFSLDQLAEIKKISIAGLICNNYDIYSIALNPFMITSKTNPNVDCSTLKSQVNLSKWKA